MAFSFLTSQYAVVLEGQNEIKVQVLLDAVTASPQSRLSHLQLESPVLVNVGSCRAAEAEAVLTFPIWAAVSPLAPRQTMDKAELMLRGEKKMFPVGFAWLTVWNNCKANSVFELWMAAMFFSVTWTQNCFRKKLKQGLWPLTLQSHLLPDQTQ